MRIQAIILKKIPIREYDELVVCYTRDAGKQAYQAKSVLLPTSKQAGHLDILTLADFSLVQGNGHPIITSAYCVDGFSNLKSSLPAMSVAFFLLECFDKLIFENESDHKLWNFLLTQLDKYDNLTKLPRPDLSRGRASVTDWQGVVTDARQELLHILGYDPSMPIEQLANSQFKSLQFARSVIR